MIYFVDDAFVERLKAFCATHCTDPEPRLRMFLDLCAVFGFRLSIVPAEQTEKA